MAALQVGDWRVDPTRNELRRGEEIARVEPKVVEVLVKLAERPGEVFPRDELLDAVWPGVVVADDALTQAVIKLRRALGDEAQQPRYIETIPKRGYRLIAPVRVAARPADRRGAEIAIAIVATVIAAVAVGVARTPWPIGSETPAHASAPPGRPPLFSLAVMPFSPASRDALDERTADELTEEATSAIERAIRFAPIAAHSRVAKYHGRLPDPQRVGRELAVRYVLEGSLRREDGALRLAVRLVETAHGNQVWSASLPGPGGGMVDGTDPAIASLTNRLRSVLYDAERKRVGRMPPGDFSPMETVLRADAALERDPSRQGIAEATKLYEQALAQDPMSTPALVGLYFALRRQLYEENPAGDDDHLVARMDEISLRALRADRTDARAWLVRSDALILRKNWDAALAATTEALRIDPLRTSAILDQTELLLQTGRPEDALGMADRGIALDPGADSVTNFLYRKCRANLFLRRYDAAIADCEKGIGLDRSYWWFAHAILAAAYARKGEMTRAAAVKSELLRNQPSLTIARMRGSHMPHPAYARLAEAELYEGLRKAGVPER